MCMFHCSCSDSAESTNTLNWQQLKRQFLILHAGCLYCIKVSFYINSILPLSFHRFLKKLKIKNRQSLSKSALVPSTLKVKILNRKSADDTSVHFIWPASLKKHHTCTNHLMHLCRASNFVRPEKKPSAVSSFVLWNTLMLFGVWQKTGPYLFAGYKPRD